MSALTRYTVRHIAVAVANAAANSTEIPLTDFVGGTIFVPAGSALTAIALHVSDAKGGTFLPLYDDNGVAATLTVAAGRAYPLPRAAAGAAALKLVGNQAQAQIVSLTLKG